MVFFSVMSFMDAFVRLSFHSAGLRPKTVEIDGDTTIHCWVSKPLLAASDLNPSPSSKPPLLLIHGFGPSSTWQWRLQVRPLARAFDLIVPDLVFFGGSTTRSAARSEGFQAACLARLLERLGVAGRVSVVGTSYGGFVAYHLARALGVERVGRVVIASSDLLKGEEDDRALRERAGVESVSDLLLPQSTENLRKLLGLCVHRQPPFMPEFVLRDVLRILYNENFEEKMQLFKGVTLGNKDEFQITPLPQEVLIVWGEHDGLFPLEKAHEIKKQLGEKAGLEILKNTSHVPQLEDPDRFNKVILSFLLGEPGSSVGEFFKVQP